MSMRKLTVVAPAEAVQELRAMAKAHGMSVYSDGKFLKLKWGQRQPVLDRARQLLPEGSFEIYKSITSGDYFRPAVRSDQEDSIRILIR